MGDGKERLVLLAANPLWLLFSVTRGVRQVEHLLGWNRKKNQSDFYSSCLGRGAGMTSDPTLTFCKCNFSSISASLKLQCGSVPTHLCSVASLIFNILGFLFLWESGGWTLSLSTHVNGCSKLVTQQGCLLSMSLRTSTPRPKLCNSASVLRSYVMNAGNARGKRMLAEPPHPQLQVEQREEHKGLSSPHPEEPVPYSSFPCSHWCESS